MTVYLVYDECHGFRGIYATPELAAEEVEHISIVEYGLRTDEEIWAEYGECGLYFVVSRKKSVPYAA